MQVTRWSDPGPETVGHGVHRIPLPLPSDGLHAVNVYAIEQPDGLVLVDAGWALTESLAELERGLALIGHDLSSVRRVLVTHVHRDHYTQAMTLRRLVGARVELGAGERPGLQELLRIRNNVPVDALARLRRAGASALARTLLAGMDTRTGAADFDDAAWGLPDSWLTAGEIELADRRLTVLPTPGHTRGHVVFLDRAASLLFAGDHVLPHITPSIGFELAAPELSLGDYLDSLRLVAGYPDARLLPAHGPVAASVHRRVVELLEHHEQRFAHTLAALGDGTATAFEIATRLSWTRRGRAFGDLDPFNQMLAVCETAAHLDVLVARGPVAVERDAGVEWYRVV
jgi:glyoxylase-like metal-dependent hydrolase (beta-lactamase superfamily II)